MKKMIEDLNKPGDLSLAPGEERCPGRSVQDVLGREDSAKEPGLTSVSYEYLGNDDLPFTRYTSQEFYDLEMKQK